MLLSLSHPSVQAMRLIRSQKETSGGVAQDGSVCVCAQQSNDKCIAQMKF